jgi:uncharacterized protein
MKIASACVALFLAATVTLAADPVPPASPAPASGKPELRGVMDLGNGQRFLLLLPGGISSNWAKVGDSVGAWKVADYRENDRTLILKQDDGTELDLTLAADHVKEGDVQATLADAKALMQKMNFGDMMTRILAQQRQAIAAIMRQQMLRRGMSPDAAAAAVAKQSQAMDAFWKAMDMNSLQDDIAGVYSQVFTKDELGGIADFYDTSAGQALLAKTPEIQQKTMQIMMPRMMQAMASMQKAAPAPAPATPAAAAGP